MVVIIILSDQLLSVPTSSLLASKLNLRVHNFTYHKLVDCSEFSIEQETLFYMNKFQTISYQGHTVACNNTFIL